jgi:CheY-like chemotaxis protein
MPRMDGRRVLSAVKTDDDLRAIPVVVFTTSSEPAGIACSDAGHAGAYVIKPIGPDDFGRVLAKIRDFYGSTATLPHPDRRP